MSTVLATTVPRKKAVRQAKPVARYWKGKAPKGADALPSDSEEEDEEERGEDEEDDGGRYMEDEEEEEAEGGDYHGQSECIECVTYLTN